MEETNERPPFLNHAAKWGAILAAIGIVMIILLYVIDYTTMVQLKFLGIVLLVDIAVIIYAGIDYRNLGGRYISYGTVWKHAFVLIFVSTIIYTLFNMLLYKVIDTELPQRLTDAAVENQRTMMQGFGAPEDQIEQGIQQAKERMEDQYTIFGMIKGVGIFMIIWAVIISLTSLIVRKNEPIEM